ncbi:proteoglycan 4 isoform X2 [Rhipicephalus sanguineus]|uniref:proteoglycan 4 isoform X2 n=1 Tax=Rhipicephalus sanguineus TaxID=34632 RepID=UPI0020C47158|nr:proteoglycan 4 isoform X2 [Rhipicephalus sanguineus]
MRITSFAGGCIAALAVAWHLVVVYGASADAASAGSPADVEAVPVQSSTSSTHSQESESVPELLRPVASSNSLLNNDATSLELSSSFLSVHTSSVTTVSETSKLPLVLRTEGSQETDFTSDDSEQHTVTHEPSVVATVADDPQSSTKPAEDLSQSNQMVMAPPSAPSLTAGDGEQELIISSILSSSESSSQGEQDTAPIVPRSTNNVISATELRVAEVTTLPSFTSGPVETEPQQDDTEEASLRVLRSIHPSSATPAHVVHHSLSREATPVSPSAAAAATERTRGGSNGSGGNPSIDNILSGIIQLLGGDMNLPRPPSMRLPPPPLPPPSPQQHHHHKPPSRINNRGPPNFNFPPPPHRPPQLPPHPPHPPPHPPHPPHSAPPRPRPSLPHLPPPHPGHFDTIPRPPPPNFHFPPVNHPNHPHHPQQHIHIVPLPHPPTVYPTPSDVSQLLGLNDPDRQQRPQHHDGHQHPPPLPPGAHDTDQHEATPALSEFPPINNGPEQPTMHRETVRDNGPEVMATATEHLPHSKSTIVLIHEGPVSSSPVEEVTPTSAGDDVHVEKTRHDGDEGHDVRPTRTETDLEPSGKVPSGPVSGWLPVFLDSSIRANSSRVSVNTAEEPEIITEPTEPSVFDITVMHSIGTVSNVVTPSQTIRPTFSTTAPSVEVGTSTESTSPDSDEIEGTEASDGELETPPSSQGSKTSNAEREPEVIYGTPKLENTPSTGPTTTLQPSIRSTTTTTGHTNTHMTKENESDVVTTLSGKGTLAPEVTHTRPPIKHNQSPTGRPIVIPVEIEDVRPVIGFPPELSHGFPRPQDGHGPQRPGASTSRPRPKEPTGPPRKSTSKPGSPARRRPGYRPKHNTTLVRIDTCIVGDDSTCDSQLNEWCKAELGVSSCHCRPGFTRTIPRGPCSPVVNVGLTLKLDRLGDKKLVFNRNYRNPESEDYQLLEYEAKQALHSLFSKSSFSRLFVDATVNRFQSAGSKVMMNATVQLEDNDITRVPSVKRVLQHEVVNMINRRNSNIGESRLYVDGLLNSGLAVDDVNECNDVTLNDCSKNAICENVFGTFRCTCKAGYTDKYPDTKWKSGRTCTACAPDYCNNRGDCRIANGQRECSCRGKYIGSRCDIDGEVLGVALGASITAVIIIVLTLVCLCLWNRRWKREQHKAEVMSAHSVGSLGYLSKASTLGPAYRVSVEDRLRWQHIADAMGNIYVQPEASAPPKTPPVFATPSRVRSPSPPEENHYSHIQRPRSRGAMYGPPPSHNPYEYETQKREMYGQVTPYYKTASHHTMYS